MKFKRYCFRIFHFCILFILRRHSAIKRFLMPVLSVTFLYMALSNILSIPQISSLLRRFKSMFILHSRSETPPLPELANLQRIYSINSYKPNISRALLCKYGTSPTRAIRVLFGQTFLLIGIFQELWTT